MWTPLPCTSRPRLWPVRCRIRSPNPASSSTSRAARSTCHPRKSALIAGRLLHQRDGRIARLPDGLECPRHLSRDLSTREPHPRNIGIYRLRVILLFAHRSSSTSSSRLNLPRAPRGRQVMRIARIFLRRHDRRRIADQTFFLEPRRHLLLDRRIRSSPRRRARVSRSVSNARSLTR